MLQLTTYINQPHQQEDFMKQTVIHAWVCESCKSKTWVLRICSKICISWII